MIRQEFRRPVGFIEFGMRKYNISIVLLNAVKFDKMKNLCSFLSVFIACDVFNVHSYAHRLPINIFDFRPQNRVHLYVAHSNDLFDCIKCVHVKDSGALRLRL